MQRTFFLLVLAAGLVGAPLPSEACSCVEPPPPSVALQRSAAVFEGTTIADIASDDGMRKNVAFRVARRWKGPMDDPLSVETASSTAACGVAFQPGETYLVYAESVDGQLMVSLCSRTRPMEMAADDLGMLGPPLAAPTGDPVAMRPAPETLETRDPLRLQEGGGCACTSRGRARFHTALLVPLGLLGFGRRRRGRAPRSLC